MYLQLVVITINFNSSISNARRNRTGETGWLVAILSEANATNRTVLQGPS